MNYCRYIISAQSFWRNSVKFNQKPSRAFFAKLCQNVDISEQTVIQQ